MRLNEQLLTLIITLKTDKTYRDITIYKLLKKYLK